MDFIVQKIQPFAMGLFSAIRMRATALILKIGPSQGWDEKTVDILAMQGAALIFAIGAWIALRAAKFLWSNTVTPFVTSLSLPKAAIPSPPKEISAGDTSGSEKVDPKAIPLSGAEIVCYDPASFTLLGRARAFSTADVKESIQLARVAQAEWKHTSFDTRRKLLRVFQRFIIDNQEAICKVSALDSGKPMVDAAFGEVIVTCEKIQWLLNEGQKWLEPELRSAGTMMFYKRATVEYHPVGVMGAIVPWNYPFHNVFNPLVANVFAGNSIVIKVSEHASWSAQWYESCIKACLRAAGAPENLVQIVYGFSEAGKALVTGGVDKLIFVGSTAIGKKVMEAASQTLTPVVLELGGKDPVIVCQGSDMPAVIQTSLRAAYQSCGQNCAGGERFIVHSDVYDKFLSELVKVASKLRQGHPLTDVDLGAMCMPNGASNVQHLLDDAVSKGAQVLVGGGMGSPSGQFFQPTIVTDVNPTMKIWTEEVFGPVMAIIKFSTEEEAVSIANGCSFGLGSNVFSGSTQQAQRIGRQLQAGMTSINDFATTYMCQSLPFGGVKDSGFDKFAGVEGLRGCCVAKAVVVDKYFFMKTTIPEPLKYPVSSSAFGFVTSLVRMFYGFTPIERLRGILGLATASVTSGKKSGKAKAA